MSNPNRQQKPSIQRTVQDMVGNSFDNEFKVIAVENLVYNAETGSLDRMTQPGAATTTAYESRNDTTTDTNLVYLGKALPGTATSSAGWQIKRYNKSAGHMSFADDVTTYTKTWDNRTSYTY